MNRSKCRYLVIITALLLALATPVFASSASVSSVYRTSTPVVSNSVAAVVPVNGYIEHNRYYRTYDDGPDGYVIHRDHYHRPYVYHRDYHLEPDPGLEVRVPFFSFRLGS